MEFVVPLLASVVAVVLAFEPFDGRQPVPRLVAGGLPLAAMNLGRQRGDEPPFEGGERAVFFANSKTGAGRAFWLLLLARLGGFWL